MYMSTDPWATADAATPAASSAGPAPAGASSRPARDLFADDEFERHPGLFTKFTPPETTFRGTILDVREIHATCHPSKSPDRTSRMKEYFQVNPDNGRTEKVLNPVNPVTREANRPVLDHVVVIQTDERDPANEDDTGIRTWFISGAKRPKDYAYPAPSTSSRAVFFGAGAAAGVKSQDECKGKPIEVTRHNRENPKVDTSHWIWSCKIG